MKTTGQANTMKPIPTSLIPIEEKARLTVVESVYYQSPLTEPTLAESYFSRWLETGEQPFVRQSKVGEQWQPLSSGAWMQQ